MQYIFFRKWYSVKSVQEHAFYIADEDVTDFRLPTTDNLSE